jgi:hypothetical protein
LFVIYSLKFVTFYNFLPFLPQPIRRMVQPPQTGDTMTITTTQPPQTAANDAKPGTIADLLPPDLVAGLQDVVVCGMASIFHAQGVGMPDVVRDRDVEEAYGMGIVYAVIGLAMPDIVGGKPVVARIDTHMLHSVGRDDVAAYVQMPGSDGYRLLTLSGVAKGIVAVHGRCVAQCVRGI